MPKASPIQTSFNAGEFSPLLKGRVDYRKYDSALARCRNYLPLVQGPLVRRPGTIFVAEVKNSAYKTVLVPFEFSTTQAYIIEFGHYYARFYMNNGQILDGGAPYEIATPYAAADVRDLRFAQSADVLYIAHPSYKPRKLSRTGHTSWTLSVVDFRDGPYLDEPLEAATLTPSGSTGTITLTASDTTGINDGLGFSLFTDLGRLIRLKRGGKWTWAQITSVTSDTEVTVEIKGEDLAGTGNIEAFRLGRWSETTGYPAVVTFYQDRLVWAGGLPDPQALDMSVSGLYEDYSPTDPDGTVADDHAISRALNATEVNAIRWMVDDEKGLMVGTTGGEWLVRAAQATLPISPTNITAARSSRRGSENVAAIKAANAALFVQRSGRKLRELAYVFEIDGFRSPDLSLLAEHLLAGGVRKIAIQNAPLAIVWAVTEDGQLLGLTYEREEDVVGWHAHSLGGYWGVDRGREPKVRDVAVIPEPNGAYDQVWLLVERYINGQFKQYVERMAKIWETGDDPELAVHLDSALTYDGAATDTFSGLDHLEGETVSVLADGASHPDKVVSGGSITLDRSASKVVVGLRYASVGQTLPINAGAADGTAQAKLKRIDRVVLRVKDLLGIETGPDEAHLSEYIFRTTDDALGERIPLYTGDLDVDYNGDYDRAGQFYWRQDNAFPGTIIAYMPQVSTFDDG